MQVDAEPTTESACICDPRLDWRTIPLMTLADQIRGKRKEIIETAARHGAGNVRLFGSAARGDDTPDSDADFLVEITGDTTPWFPGSLVADLEGLLGRRVQVVIQRSLSPYIRDAVLREARPL